MHVDIHVKLIHSGSIQQQQQTKSEYIWAVRYSNNFNFNFIEVRFAKIAAPIFRGPHHKYTQIPYGFVQFVSFLCSSLFRIQCSTFAYIVRLKGIPISPAHISYLLLQSPSYSASRSRSLAKLSLRPILLSLRAFYCSLFPFCFCLRFQIIVSDARSDEQRK